MEYACLLIFNKNGTDKSITSDILKLVDDNKIFVKVGSSESFIKLNKGLRVLCKWSETWQMKFSTDSFKVLHIGANK